MATSTLQNFTSLVVFFTLLVAFFGSGIIQAQVIDEKGLKVMSDAVLDWPMSAYLDESEDGLVDFDDDEEINTSVDRRSLFWRRVHYYISYGALSANRIPCPPRSGRSYYTHNCFRSRAPANPYSRGCSRITRCRR